MMGAGSKCKSCGSSDLEVDPSRGDTICTNCGTVLEDSVIVSEVQFEENARGINSAVGQFVASDSSGGCRGFGSGFHGGGVRESREITLQNAKKGIVNLCQNLRLNQHCIDTAFNFYKMALTRNLTRGRKHMHILAACVYITCRIEGTPHLLIDFSDLLQICAFELGRTYLKLSQALCITVPALDPCMYVLRFANKLEFGEKTHEVTMTALRLVQRMKRDSMHYGRRPSGICGAALLMAGRLHEFNRTVGDIVKVVQVHETTLRKRLVEFGETPSSSLTLAEFMTVDLEEEQDPPSFRAARAKDRERLKAFDDKEQLSAFNQLQTEINKHICRKRKPTMDSTNDEDRDFDNFVSLTTMDVIEDIEEEETLRDIAEQNIGIGPTVEVMGLTERDKLKDFTYETSDGNLEIGDLDDNELDKYIMSEDESQGKEKMWVSNNADYLKAKKEKEEKEKKEKEEGKPDKKKRKTRKKNTTPASTASEAIEKMLQEKKISAKINYDVLKSLNVNMTKMDGQMIVKDMKAEEVLKEEIISSEQTKEEITEKHEPDHIQGEKHDETEMEDEYEDNEDCGEVSLAQMLSQHNNQTESGNYYDYDEEDY